MRTNPASLFGKVFPDMIFTSSMNEDEEPLTEDEQAAKEMNEALVNKRTILHVENQRTIVGALQKRILDMLEDNETLSESQLTIMVHITFLMKEHIDIKDISDDLFTKP